MDYQAKILCILICIFIPVLADLEKVHIVHMDVSHMPNSFSDHQSWYESTLQSLTASISNPPTRSKLLHSYSNAIHGFSVKLSSAELRELEKSPGFVSSLLDVALRPDTTHTSQFLHLNSEFGAWPVSSYGSDVIIGVVDTGIWPESESFNDDGMTDIPTRWKGECENGTSFDPSLCNKKLVGARYFNKGFLASSPNTSIEMNSARDMMGHGTHTSSTAAGNFVRGASYFGYANGTATGTAPNARLAVYKVMWGDMSYASDIIAAIDKAIDDGVDVLSLSFGEDLVPLYADPVAIATFSATMKGIFVAASAGNAGANSYGFLHNGTPWLLTVAAGTIDRELNGIATLGNGDSLIGVSVYAGNSTSRLPLVFMEACNSSKMTEVAKESIIVCQSYDNSVPSQAYNVYKTGVAGGIFISNDTSLDLLQPPFPYIYLDLTKGDIILSYMKKSSMPKASLNFGMTRIGRNPAPMVAEYSSRGPSRSCPHVLKPDLMGPGTQVLGAWPPNIPAQEVGISKMYTKFNLQSGTSMACPHIAGIAALVKSARPEWSPAAIKSALMTTAYRVNNNGDPIRDIGDSYSVATPLAMGAGHVNPNQALHPGLIYDATPEDYVRLLCSMNYTINQIQTVTKSSMYNCSKKSMDLNYPSFIAFFNNKGASSKSKVFRRTVTNVEGGMSSYSASVTPMAGFIVTVTPSKLSFTSKNQKRRFKLTIQGLTAMNEDVVHGYLTWTDTEGQFLVQSPIVATKVDSLPFSQ